MTQEISPWSREEIIAAMAANKHLHMTCFAGHISTIERVFEPDVTVIRSEISSDTFNYVLAAHFTSENVAQRVAHVISLYRSVGLPFSWWVGEGDTPIELESELVAQGLSLKEENVGMYLDLELFVPPSGVPKVQIQRATTLEQLRDFSQVIVAVGENPQVFDQLYSKIPSALYQEGSNLEIALTYVEGAAVGIGILLFHANVAGIYYIGTIPEQRKKGYATAMMDHLLQRAKSQGYAIVTLQASQEGKALYERLGFQGCCRFKEFF